MAINTRLKAARVGKGLTQLQLAEQAGMREIDISRMETGRTTPSLEVKQRIAALLEKPPFEIFPC